MIQSFLKSDARPVWADWFCAVVLGTVAMMTSMPAVAAHTTSASLYLLNAGSGSSDQNFTDPLSVGLLTSTYTNGIYFLTSEGAAHATWGTAGILPQVGAYAATAANLPDPFNHFSPFAHAKAQAILSDEFEIWPAPPLSHTTIQIKAFATGSAEVNGTHTFAEFLATLASTNVSESRGVRKLIDTRRTEPELEIGAGGGPLSIGAEIRREGTRAFVSYTLVLTAAASSYQGVAEADAGHTLKLTSIEFLSGETPESLGHELIFSSGSVSPNLVVPEPSSICLTLLGAILSLGWSSLCAYRDRHGTIAHTRSQYVPQLRSVANRPQTCTVVPPELTRLSL